MKNKTENMESIECVALKHTNGLVFSVPKPGRHHNVIWLIVETFNVKTVGSDYEQGFLTSQGRFVGREEAAKIALQSGQINATKWGTDLFSEDLW